MARSESDQPEGGIDLPCEPPPKPIVERLDEPIHEAAECCIVAGQPYLVFDDWDYAEDWAGEFVRVVHPDTLTGRMTIAPTDFWALVRRVHGLS
jgi:hypothetical protein